MQFWQKLHTELAAAHTAVLLYVVHSRGSSPGRQGFRMLVSSSGLLHGSIGGGIMEHKLVEWCKKRLLKGPFEPMLKQQIHRAGTGRDRSGMICSGEQTIAFYFLDKNSLPLAAHIARSLVAGARGLLRLSETGIAFDAPATATVRYQWSAAGKRRWAFLEATGLQPRLFIVGAGHVSQALAQMAAPLDFAVTVLDDRTDLNTAPDAGQARFVHVPDYADIARHLSEGPQHYVVLMSFGYRTDKIVLRQLLGKSYRYLGMLGSAEKVKTLFRELQTEGIPPDALQAVHAPVGLPIHSRTPAEIAVSILAELILVKNSADADI